MGGGSCEHCNTCRATWQCESQAVMGAHATRCPARPVSCPASRGTLAAASRQYAPFGAHHSPDLFHVPYELRKAVSAPMAAKQQAAAQAMTKAEEMLTRMQAQLPHITNEPAKRSPGRPPKVAVSLEHRVGGGRGSPRAPTSHRAARDNQTK